MMFQREIKGLKAVVEEKTLFPALYQFTAKMQATTLSSSISRCHTDKPGDSDVFLRDRELRILFAIKYSHTLERQPITQICHYITKAELKKN